MLKPNFCGGFAARRRAVPPVGQERRGARGVLEGDTAGPRRFVRARKPPEAAEKDGKVTPGIRVSHFGVTCSRQQRQKVNLDTRGKSVHRICVWLFILVRTRMQNLKIVEGEVLQT